MAAKFVVSEEVRDVLRRSEVACVEGAWRLALPEQIDPKLYKKVMKVIEGAGGTWKRHLGLHVFAGDPREALGLAVESGVGTNRKQALQAFYSPPEVARRVVDLSNLGEHNLSVLEPSAGEGALVRAALEASPSARIDAYEVDPETLGRLASSVGVGPERAGWCPRLADFLAVPGRPTYDRVLMNPPWSGGQAEAHVTHATKFLRPGGILVAVMPSSSSVFKTSGRMTKARREWLLVCNQGDASWEDLPEGSFRESGTDVWAGIFRLEKAP